MACGLGWSLEYVCLCKMCSVYLTLQSRFIVPSYPNTDLNSDAQHELTSECLSAAHLRKENIKNDSINLKLHFVYFGIIQQSESKYKM